MTANVVIGKRTANDALLMTDPRPPKRSSHQEGDLDGTQPPQGGWRWTSLLGSLVESAIKSLTIGGDSAANEAPTEFKTPNATKSVQGSNQHEQHPISISRILDGQSSTNLSHTSPFTSPKHQRPPAHLQPRSQPPLSLEDLTTPRMSKPQTNGNIQLAFPPRIVNHGSRLGGSIYPDSRRRLLSTPSAATPGPISDNRPGSPGPSIDQLRAPLVNPFTSWSPRSQLRSLNSTPFSTSTPISRRIALSAQRNVPASPSSTSPYLVPSSKSDSGRQSSSSSLNTLNGIVKPYGNRKKKEHIHAKLHSQQVREAMQKELYEIQRSHGYSQDYATFKDYLSYRERLEALESQDLLSASSSIPFSDIPPLPRKYSSLRSGSSSTTLGSSTLSKSLGGSFSSNASFANSVASPYAHRSRSRSISSASSALSSSASVSSSITSRYQGLGWEWGYPARRDLDLSSQPLSPLWLQKAMQRAKESLDAPRPPRPNVAAFDKLRLEDKQRDDEITRRIQEASKRKKLPASLPTAHARTVKSILSNKEFKSKAGKEQVAAGDISRLGPGQWLNDEIINFWGAMLMERSERVRTQGQANNASRELNGKGKGRLDESETDSDEEGDLPPRGDKAPLPNIHCFSTFFFSKLESPGYEKARLNKWTKKIDVFSRDIIVIPVNVGNAHWTCAAINLQKKRIEYYDSMGSKREKIYHLLRSYLDKEHQDKKKKPFDFTGWADYFDEETPQQENGYDCGVFTCQVMEALSRGEETSEFSFGQRQMPYLRQRMIWEIARGRLP